MIDSAKLRSGLKPKGNSTPAIISRTKYSQTAAYEIMIETTSASGQTSKEVRSLSADGKTMTVVRTFQGQSGEMTRKTVYDKQ